MLNKTELNTLGLESPLDQIYLDCLQHKQNTPTTISRRTGIKRTTLYGYIDTLKHMGFLYEKVTSKRKSYFPFPVKKALDNFEQYKQRELSHYSKQKENLSQKLNSLSVHQTVNLTNSVGRYYGNDGMMTLANLVLEIDADTDLFGSTQSLFSIMDEDTMFKNYSVKRMDSDRKTRDIIDKEYLNSPRSYMCSPMFSELKTLEFPEHIKAVQVVSGNHVALGKRSGNQPEAIVFEDKEYADLLRFMYEQLWQLLPAVDMKKIRMERLE